MVGLVSNTERSIAGMLNLHVVAYVVINRKETDGTKTA